MTLNSQCVISKIVCLIVPRDSTTIVNYNDRNHPLLYPFLYIHRTLGSGAFGEVYQGTLLGPETDPTPVAVKTLHKGAGPEEQRKFISEAVLMRYMMPYITCIILYPIYSITT